MFLSKIYNSRKLVLVSIFIASVAVSLVFLFFLRSIGPEGHNVLGTDYRTCYEPFAKSIARGEIVYLSTYNNIENSVCAPPGYPLMLVLIISLSNLLNIPIIYLIFASNIIATALGACLLFLIAELIFNKRIALISSLLWLSYPFNLWFLKNPHTEIPFILFFLLGIYLYLLALRNKRMWYLFFSGAILGFSILIRPAGFFLPFLFGIGIFFLLKEKSLKTKIFFFLIFWLGCLLIVLPWEIALFLKTNQILFLDTRGTTPINIGLTYPLKKVSGSGFPLVPGDVFNLMKEIKDATLLDKDFNVVSFMSKELVLRPVPVIKLLFLKLARSWYATSQMWLETKTLLMQLVYLIPALFGIYFAFKRYKEKFKHIVFLLSMVVCFWGLTFIALSILRYMIPVMAIIMIFSAITISLIIQRIYERSRI